MILIWDVTSAADAQAYYASCISAGTAPDRQGYYSEGQESPGVYGGKLAERLGLAGKTVDKESFDRLCDNRHPSNDNESLTPRTNSFRRVCKDLTFSGPKSFSIAEAFASEDDRRDLRQAFDESVAETTACDIEPDMQSRVRKGGADYDRTTGNALTAGFNHLTDRPVNDDTPPDMHYHQHLLVWNATYDPVEKRIKAGQVGDIVRDKAYYRAAFYSRLAEKLEALGYGIDRRGGNEWEIAGIPQSMIDKFSKRTAQIEAEAKRLGITDPAAKSRLGAKTRAGKQKDLTMPELRRAWDDQLTDGERDALAAVYARQAEGSKAVTAKEAVAYAIDHLTEQRSMPPEREFKRVAMLHGLGCLTPEAIAAEMQNPVHGLIVGEIDGRQMATTEKLQAEEDGIVGFAARGKGSMDAAGVSPELERGRLNDGQWKAVTGLLESKNRVNVVIGPAGAGKTDMLKTYCRGMELAGKTVGFLATSSDAVDVLRKDGFADAATMARFLLDEKLQNSLKNGHVVCDESSMLGHKDACRFFELADKLNLSVTLMGDPRQHGSVPRGALLHLMKNHAGIQEFRLTEIMRQKHAGYKAAVESLAEGQTLAGFDALDGLGWVKEIDGDKERIGQLAGEYVQAAKDRESCLVVSPTHAEGKAITAEIRSQLRDAGMLGVTDHAFTRLVPVNASEAERGQASTYGNGPLVLQFHQNAKSGFVKGDRLLVSDASMVPLSEAAKFGLYRQETIGLAVGDKLRFTNSEKTLDGKHTLKNGAVRSIKAIDRDRITLDNGWIISGKKAGHFRYGFTDTSFGSQGKTVDRVLLGMSAASAAAMNQEQMYVSASRGRHKLTLYTDDKAAIRSAIGRSSHKLAALDLQRKAKPKLGQRMVAFHSSLKDRLKRLAHRNLLMNQSPGRLPGPGLPPHTPLPGLHSGRRMAERQERGFGHER